MKKKRWFFSHRLYGVFIFLSLFHYGCATKMVVIPQLEPINIIPDYKIEGKILYDGNKEYLPRCLIDDIAAEPLLTLNYSYDVTYGKDTTPQLIPLLNPLTDFGFPIGMNTVMITGKLDIYQGKEVVKSYASSCGFEVTRNLFWEGETFSVLRKKGLIVVRDNIESQIYRDKVYLTSITNSNQAERNAGKQE
jgi:hypothetical protein